MEVMVVGKCLNKVKVNTKIGSFNGIWCSSDPTLFKKYSVELDCDEVINQDVATHLLILLTAIFI